MVTLSRPFDDPVSADVSNLDLVTFLFFYHDTTYMGVDRAKMNAKLFAALKPGGFLVIADHSAVTWSLAHKRNAFNIQRERLTGGILRRLRSGMSIVTKTPR